MLYETKGGKAEKLNIYSSANGISARRGGDSGSARQREIYIERESFILDHVDLIDRSTIEKKTFLKSTIDQIELRFFHLI